MEILTSLHYYFGLHVTALFYLSFTLLHMLVITDHHLIIIIRNWHLIGFCVNLLSHEMIKLLSVLYIKLFLHRQEWICWILTHYKGFYLALLCKLWSIFNSKFKTLKTTVGNRVFSSEHTLFSHNLKYKKLLNVKQLESDV